MSARSQRLRVPNSVPWPTAIHGVPRMRASRAASQTDRSPDASIASGLQSRMIFASVRYRYAASSGGPGIWRSRTTSDRRRRIELLDLVRGRIILRRRDDYFPAERRELSADLIRVRPDAARPRREFGADQQELHRGAGGSVGICGNFVSIARAEASRARRRQIVFGIMSAP